MTLLDTIFIKATNAISPVFEKRYFDIFGDFYGVKFYGYQEIFVSEKDVELNTVNSLTRKIKKQMEKEHPLHYAKSA